MIGQGWASCNPERTQMCYKLLVYRLQVGDVIISLTPRDKPPPQCSFTSRQNSSTTVITTATSTTMTSKQLSVNNNVAFMSSSSEQSNINNNNNAVHLQLHQQHKSTNQSTSCSNPSIYTQHQTDSSTNNTTQISVAVENLAAKKRRWSAPDQICDENNEQIQKRRVE